MYIKYVTPHYFANDNVSANFKHVSPIQPMYKERVVESLSRQQNHSVYALSYII